jgi:ketosteroid isomerase-like protein
MPGATSRRVFPASIPRSSFPSEELRDLGDQILATTRHHGRGKGSGAEVELRIFQLWTLRNDKVVRARMYYGEAEALEAAGSSE